MNFCEDWHNTKLVANVSLAASSEVCLQPEGLEDLFTFAQTRLSSYLSPKLDQQFKGIFSYLRLFLWAFFSMNTYDVRDLEM